MSTLSKVSPNDPSKEISKVVLMLHFQNCILQLIRHLRKK